MQAVDNHMPGAQAQGGGRQQQRVALCLPAFPRSRSSSSTGASDTNRTKDNDAPDHNRHGPADFVSGTFSHGPQQSAVVLENSLKCSTGMARHRAPSHSRCHSSMSVPAHMKNYSEGLMTQPSTLHSSVDLPRQAIKQHVVRQTPLEEIKQPAPGTRLPHQRQHGSAASSQEALKTAAVQWPYLGKSLDNNDDDATHIVKHSQSQDTDADDCRQQDQLPRSQHSQYRQHEVPVARSQQHRAAELPGSTRAVPATAVVTAAAPMPTHASGTEKPNSDLDALIRDVAARIIQTHWRRRKQTCVTVHHAQATTQVVEAYNTQHDNNIGASEDGQLKIQASSRTRAPTSAQDQSQRRGRGAYSPGRSAASQHSLRQAHRAKSPGRHTSPGSPGPSKNRGQPGSDGRAPPSHASCADGVASCLNGITESKTSHYKVYTVAPSPRCKRPDNGYKGTHGMAAASLSLLDEDSMPLMAQPSRHTAGAAGLRSSIDSAKRGTRRRMVAVGLSCDLPLTQQQQEGAFNSEVSKQWQLQEDSRQGDTHSRVQARNGSQLAWQQNVAQAQPAGSSQQRGEFATQVAAQQGEQLVAEASSSSTQLAEPSFNLDSRPAPDDGVDMPTLLEQLRAGQVPDGADQEQLELLLAAIGSTRCSSSAIQDEQGLDAAQGGPPSGTEVPAGNGDTVQQQCSGPARTAWAQLQPAGTCSGSAPRQATGIAGLVSPSDMMGGSGCVTSSMADGSFRSARAREATREKLRNLRRSVHSSSGGGSILAGHATTVVRAFDQQGAASAGMQQHCEAQRSPQFKDRAACAANAVEQPVLNFTDSLVASAASGGVTGLAMNASQSMEGGSEQVMQESAYESRLHSADTYGLQYGTAASPKGHGQAADFAIHSHTDHNFVGQVHATSAAAVSTSYEAVAQDTAVQASSWKQARTSSSSHWHDKQSASTPTKHTPVAKPPAAATLEPPDYSLPEVSITDEHLLRRQQHALCMDQQVTGTGEAPHYIWPSSRSPVSGNEVCEGSKRTPTPSQQHQSQPQAMQGHLVSKAGASPISMAHPGILLKVPLQLQQTVLMPGAAPPSLAAALPATESQNATACCLSQQGQPDLINVQQPAGEKQVSGAAAAAAAAAVSPRGSLNTEKLRSILDFLNDVDQRSIQDTAHAAMSAAMAAPRLVCSASTPLQSHTGKALAAALAQSELSEVSSTHANSASQPAAVEAHDMSSRQPDCQLSSAKTSPKNPVMAATQQTSAQHVAEEVLQRAGLLEVAAAGTSHVAVTASLNQLLDGQESLASIGFDSSVASLPEPHPAWQTATAAAGQRQQAGIPRSSRVSLGSHDGRVSLQGSVTSSASARPAVLAESVFDGVKSKMRRLQEELRERDSTCALLKRELEGTQQRAAQLVADTERRAEEALTASRADHEAALARHLSFMDRLLADKDELNRKVLSMAEAAKAQEERHERTVAKLKEGWVSELKRQKEAWTASERLKREQWQENKAAEVKELTVKGLEVEVQKLLAKHKAEVAAVQQAAAEEAKRVLDVVAAQHELAIRQLKEKLAREGEDVIEKERASAAQRLREASERYEQQLSMQRLRLVADGDLRLEQLEAARREERKRADDALAKAAVDADVRVREVEEEARKEREALRRAHDKQMEALRQELSSDQEGWRAALAERSRRDLEQQEAALMERLLRERDEQLQVIVQRLESESQAAREAMRREASERETAMASRHAAALKEAKRTETRLQEQLLSEADSRQAAEARLAAMQAQLEEARHELEARAATIRWLEAQLSAAQQQAQATEAARQAASNQALQEVLRDKEAADRQVVAMQQELQGLRSRHTAEMEHVEARVRAALTRKDEALSSSMQQVAMLTAQLKHTEAVLAAQQAELGAL